MSLSNIFSPFLSVRGYIVSSMLLEKQQIDALVSSRNTREIWERLQETLLKGYLNDDVPEDEASFRTEMLALLHRLLSSFGRTLNKEKRDYLDVFLLETELDILKSIVRVWVDEENLEETAEIPRTSRFTDEIVNRLIAARHPVNFEETAPLPAWLIRGLARHMRETELLRNETRLRKLYSWLDAQYELHLWAEAEKFGKQSSSIRWVLGQKIDLLNLERVFRGIVFRFPEDEVKDSLVKIGYRLDVDQLEEACSCDTLDELKDFLEGSAYSHLLERGIDKYLKTEKTHAAANVFREFELSALRRFLVEEPLPFTPVSDFSMGMLVALIRLLIVQSEVLSQVFRGVSLDLEKDQIRDMISYYR